MRAPLRITTDGRCTKSSFLNQIARTVPANPFIPGVSTDVTYVKSSEEVEVWVDYEVTDATRNRSGREIPYHLKVAYVGQEPVFSRIGRTKEITGKHQGAQLRSAYFTLSPGSIILECIALHDGKWFCRYIVCQGESEDDTSPTKPFDPKHLSHQNRFPK